MATEAVGSATGTLPHPCVFSLSSHSCLCASLRALRLKVGSGCGCTTGCTCGVNAVTEVASSGASGCFSCAPECLARLWGSSDCLSSLSGVAGLASPLIAGASPSISVSPATPKPICDTLGVGIAGVVVAGSARSVMDAGDVTDAGGICGMTATSSKSPCSVRFV